MAEEQKVKGKWKYSNRGTLIGLIVSLLFIAAVAIVQSGETGGFSITYPLIALPILFVFMLIGWIIGFIIDLIRIRRRKN